NIHLMRVLHSASVCLKLLVGRSIARTVRALPPGREGPSPLSPTSPVGYLPVSILPYSRGMRHIFRTCFSIISATFLRHRAHDGNHLVPDVSPPFSQCAGGTRVSASFFLGTEAAKRVSLISVK